MHIEKRHYRGAIGVALIGLAALGSGWVSTSRPSSPELSTGQTIAVTTSRDSGPGSLREAIFGAARSTSRTRIEINVRRIELGSPLPAIVNPRGVVVDAGESGCRIDARAIAGAPALDIASPNSVVTGMAIEHAAVHGILVRANGVRLRNVELVDCAEGVRLSATVDVIIEDSVFRQNGRGIVFTERSAGTIRRNRFFGQDDAAIWVVNESPRESATEQVQILSNEFEQNRVGVVAINVPVLIERNEFRRERESAIYLMGTGAVVRNNRVREGVSIGIFGDSAVGAVVEGNELDRNAVGFLLRSSRNSLAQNNRIHSNAYGVAVVFGDGSTSNLFTDNLVASQTYDGFYLVGASPILRRNVAVRNQKAALRLLEFVPRSGANIPSVPLLTANRFEANLMNEPVMDFYREPEVRQ